MDIKITKLPWTHSKRTSSMKSRYPMACVCWPYLSSLSILLMESCLRHLRNS